MKDFGKVYSGLGMKPATLKWKMCQNWRIAMVKKSERRNKKGPGTLGNKGSVMSGDDSQNSKSPVNVNIHERRTIQKKRGNR